MKTIFIFLIVGIIAASCGSTTSTNEEVVTQSVNYQDSVIEEMKADEKAFKKTGIVRKEVDGVTVKDKSVNIWMFPDIKTAVYQLSPGEQVYVYNERKDGYLLISPASDTTRSGYLLKGWIEYAE